MARNWATNESKKHKFLSIVIFGGNKWDLQFSSEICKHFKCKQACSTVNTFEMLWHCKLNMNSICIQYICVQYCTICLLLSKFSILHRKKNYKKLHMLCHYCSHKTNLYIHTARCSLQAFSIPVTFLGGQILPSVYLSYLYNLLSLLLLTQIWNIVYTCRN